MRSQQTLLILRSQFQSALARELTGCPFNSVRRLSASDSHSSPESTPSEERRQSGKLASALCTVSDEFRRAPLQAASELTKALSPAQRALLAQALSQDSDGSNKWQDESYVDELFQAVDTSGPKGLLTRSEFQKALMGHELLYHGQPKPPGLRALRMVALASSIPFVAFGFLDNSIMIMAGEEIDAIFGVRLGLSTLASAGLGNMVADVVGVGAANIIEQSVRKLPFVKEPALSRQQMVLSSVRSAKMVGAVVGVMCGCLLGLAPLVLGGTFFVPGGRHPV